MGAFQQFLLVDNWVQLTIEEGRIELYSSLGTQPSLIKVSLYSKPCSRIFFFVLNP